MELKEKTLKHNTVYEGKKFIFNSDEVLLPNGDTSKRDYVSHPGGVTVAALDADNELYFVNQFRYPYGKVIIELPAGTLEKGENPLNAGIRELHEETGIIAGDMVSLGEFYPSCGYSDEVIYLYYTRVAGVKSQKLDDDEFINVVKMPFERALEMVLNNEIKDGKSQALILKLAMVLNKKS